MTPDWYALYRPPHCDQKVLHSKNAGCDFCNDEPLAQALRECWGINFSGENDPDKLLCPSEYGRSPEVINQWEGNRPQRRRRFFHLFYGKPE